MVGKLRYGDLEAGLYSRHHLLVALRGDKGDRKTLGTETPSTTVESQSVYIPAVEHQHKRTRHDEGSCRRREGSRS